MAVRISHESPFGSNVRARYSVRTAFAAVGNAVLLQVSRAHPGGHHLEVAVLLRRTALPAAPARGEFPLGGGFALPRRLDRS